MAQSLLSRLNLSKERLTELQNGLFLKGEGARDASLSAIYGLGASTLTTAADLSERVPLVQGSSEGLRQKAEALQDAGKAVQRPPINEYDELNVQQVNQALEGLSEYELEKVRRYEESNKNRVTVLREVERLLG